MLTMWRALLCCLLMVVSTSCRAGSVEKQFFRGDIPTRMERLETYPLEQQWRIFLYGNQVIHPPTTGLALPIAKQGKPALDYILQQLEHPKHELDFRDSMVVFERMQQGGYYDVCGASTAMEAIRRNENRISHAGWRDVYRQMSEDLCRETTGE